MEIIDKNTPIDLTGDTAQVDSAPMGDVSENGFDKNTPIDLTGEPEKEATDGD